MPDTTSSPTEAEPAKAGKSRLLIAGVLCVAIAGGGFVIGGRMSGGAEAEVVVEEAEEVEPVIAEIVDLEPINVNLAAGHYLRVAVSLGLSAHDEEEGGGGGHGKDAEAESSFATAPASDLVVGTFSGRAMEELSTHEGRESARHDLLEGLEQYYGHSVITVLFTEFVMQ